jgi:hypothetical protein|tara:strand:- start:5406 stop:5684 length:279 start_codon:yes stop_codon:yes gene_type:complete
MKVTLFCTAVRPPFSSEYQLRISNEDFGTTPGMEENKLGSFEVEIPADIESAFTELLIDSLEDVILEAHKSHTTHVNNLSNKLNLLNEKLAR